MRSKSKVKKTHDAVRRNYQEILKAEEVDIESLNRLKEFFKKKRFQRRKNVNLRDEI